jgi:hypothetical protein
MASLHSDHLLWSWIHHTHLRFLDDGLPDSGLVRHCDPMVLRPFTNALNTQACDSNDHSHRTTGKRLQHIRRTKAAHV